MRKSKRLFSVLAVLTLLVGVTAAAPMWGAGVGPAAAQETSDIQIYDPDNGSVITTQEEETIFGRVWMDVDPPPFPEPPVLEPIANFGGGSTYTVDWNDVPDATNYVLQESSEADFSTTTDYAASDSEYFVTGKAVGTYYYRVAAYNAESRPSRWSNVEAVTVEASTASGAQPEAELFDWSLLAPTQVNVEVSIDGGPWQPAVVSDVGEDWYEWSYDWDVPELDGEEVTIAARALDETDDSIFATDEITVTVDNNTFILYMPYIPKRFQPIPYPPTNIAVTDPGETATYTVSWDDPSTSDVPVTLGYDLQEATDINFTQDVQMYNVSTTSYQFTDKPGGNYYYRVRGKNAFGVGEWSNIAGVAVVGAGDQSYDWSDDREGWFIARSDEGEGQQLPAPVQKDGLLYHLVWGRADFSILSPMEEGPSAPYTIRTRVDIVDSERINGQLYEAKTGMTWGILFGANDGSPCPAERDDPNGCLNQYYRLLITWDQANGAFKYELKRIDYHEGDDGGGQGRGETLISFRTVRGFDYNASGYNEWRIDVTDESSGNIEIYMNEHFLGSATDHEFMDDDHRYFGFFLSSTDELGGVATKWDWFRIED